MWVTACALINGVCAFHENTSLSSFCICTGIFFQQSIDWSVFVSQRANLVKLPSCSHFSPISSAYYFSVHYRHTFRVFFPFSGECTNCALQSTVLITEDPPYGSSGCCNQCPAMSHTAAPCCPCVPQSDTGENVCKAAEGTGKAEWGQTLLKQITESQRHSIFLFVAQGSLCLTDFCWFVLFCFLVTELIAADIWAVIFCHLMVSGESKKSTACQIIQRLSIMKIHCM